MTANLLNDFLEGKKYPSDLIIIVIWSVLAVAGALLLPDGNAGRIILAIPLIIFIPGYSMVSALWPQGLADEPDDKENNPEKREIDNLERVALSFGLSIAIAALIGIGLNSIWDISFVPILSSLFGFIVITSSFAWYRRMTLPVENRFSVSFVVEFKSILGEWTQVDKVIAVFLVISLIVAGSVLAYMVITPPDGENFSELYILDQNYTIEHFPTNLTANETGTIIIGVVCHEYEVTNYTVVVTLSNMTGERQNISLMTYNIVLEHEGMNETMFLFQINETGEYKLKIELYKEYAPTPYLESHLWVRFN